MRISYTEPFAGRPARIMQPAQAFDHAATPDVYSFDGALERERARVDKLAELTARMFTVLVEGAIISTEQAQEILGYGFTVKEDHEQ